VYSAKSHGSSYDAQPSIYRYVNWSLFSCHSKFYHLFQNLGLFKNVATQFIGRQGLMNQATIKMPDIDRKIRISYHIFTYT
jgi:hypothetical protein